MKIFLIAVSCLLFNFAQGMEQDNSPEPASKEENKIQKQAKLNFSKLTLVLQLQHAFAQTIATHLLKKKALKVLNCEPIPFLYQLPSKPEEALKEAFTRLKLTYPQEIGDKVALALAFHILFSKETPKQKIFYLSLLLPYLCTVDELQKQRFFPVIIREILPKQDILSPNTLMQDPVLILALGGRELEASSYTLLHLAAFLNDRAIIQALFSFQALVNAQDKNNATPLHYAAGHASSEMISLLLEHGALDTLKNVKGIYPLTIGFSNRNKDSILRFIKEPEYLSDDKLLTLLLQKCLLEAYDTSIPTYVMKLLKEKNRFKALSPFIKFCFAIATHFPRFFKYYNESNLRGQIGSVNTSALNIAAAFGNKEALSFLLEHGEDINVYSSDNATPLHEAIIADRSDIALMLIEKEANLELLNFENLTPLSLGVLRDNERITEILLNYKANTEAVNDKGATSLHLAVLNDNKAIVKLLIEKGANLESQDSIGRTPLHYSIQLRSSPLIELFLKAFLMRSTKEAFKSIIANTIISYTYYHDLEDPETPERVKGDLEIFGKELNKLKAEWDNQTNTENQE